jgi:di/tricarboxylate transporter
MVPYLIFGASALIQSLTAFAAYLIFGGWRAKATPELTIFLESQRDAKFSRSQIVTLAGIGALIVSVVFFHVPISIGAFVIAALLLFFELADGEVVVKMMPWDAIMLVTGITVLIGVLEKSGGMDLATTLIASYSTPTSVNALLAFVTGILSAYSSSSGVVMPAFIPLVPGIVEKMGTGNIVEMLVAVAVGSHMVDVSPLSTLGALCIACIVNPLERSKVFRSLLLWGMSMAVVGALLSWIFLDLL